MSILFRNKRWKDADGEIVFRLTSTLEPWFYREVINRMDPDKRQLWTDAQQRNAIDVHMLVQLVREHVFPTVTDEMKQLTKHAIQKRAYPMPMRGESDDAYIRRQSLAWMRLVSSQNSEVKGAEEEEAPEKLQILMMHVEEPG